MDEAAASEAAGERWGKNRLDGELENTGLLNPILDTGGAKEEATVIFGMLGLWLEAVAGGEDDDGLSIGSEEFDGLERCVSLDWITSGAALIPIDIDVLRDVGDWNGGCICCGIGANGWDGGCIAPLNPGCGPKMIKCTVKCDAFVLL